MHFMKLSQIFSPYLEFRSGTPVLIFVSTSAQRVRMDAFRVTDVRRDYFVNTRDAVHIEDAVTLTFA